MTIQDLGDYVTWLHGKDFKPATLARHLVSLRSSSATSSSKAFSRRIGGIAGQPEALERVPHVLSPSRSTPCWKAGERRSFLAARSGPAGTALCNGLPGLGAVEPQARRRSPRRRLLSLSWQGGQGAACGPLGRRAIAGLSGVAGEGTAGPCHRVENARVGLC